MVSLGNYATLDSALSARKSGSPSSLAAQHEGVPSTAVTGVLRTTSGTAEGQVDSHTARPKWPARGSTMHSSAACSRANFTATSGRK